MKMVQVRKRCEPKVRGNEPARSIRSKSYLYRLSDPVPVSTFDVSWGDRKTVREYDLVRVASHVIAFRPFRPKGLGNDLSQGQLDTV